MTDAPPTLSTDEAATLLRVHPKTLQRAAKRGDAPVTPIKVGRCLRWPAARLAEVLGVDTGELWRRLGLIESVRASRAAQGLPPTIEDPAVLERVAALLRSDR